MTAQFVQPGDARLVLVYVPSTRHDKPISDAEHEEYVEVVETRLSKMFGGATSIAGIGSYYSEELQSLIREKITVVYSYTEFVNLAQGKEIRLLAKWLAIELEQESILVVIEDKYYFIS